MFLLENTEKIEKIRELLNKAIESNASKETILKISQRLDKYIVKKLSNSLKKNKT